MSNGLLAELAIVGGSGLYDLAGIEDVEQTALETPFGAPSDAVRVGRLAGRRVAFLARHGPGHRLLPSEINYRANVFALKPDPRAIGRGGSCAAGIVGMHTAQSGCPAVDARVIEGDVDLRDA